MEGDEEVKKVQGVCWVKGKEKYITTLDCTRHENNIISPRRKNPADARGSHV